MSTSGPRKIRLRYQDEIILASSCTDAIRKLGCLPPGSPITAYVIDVQRRVKQLHGVTVRKKPMFFLLDLARVGEVELYEIADGRRGGS